MFFILIANNRDKTRDAKENKCAEREDFLFNE